MIFQNGTDASLKDYLNYFLINFTFFNGLLEDLLIFFKDISLIG